MRILQIFNRYEFIGGEEIMMHRIGEVLSKTHDVDYFLGSTAELIGRSRASKLLAPFKTIHNWEAMSRLRRSHQEKKFDLWIVHNAFPGLSPAIYELGFRLRVPIIQYLHNYRLSCTNGFFLNHGELCTRCLNGNFLPAFTTACWRNSRIASGVMGVALTRVRQLRVFSRVQHFVAVSEAQRALHLRMGIPPERITTVPHFVDPPAETFPVPEDGYLLFLGRLSPEKGVKVVLEAWARRSNPNGRLVIAGTGPEEATLKEFCESRKLSNVQFTGFVDRHRLDQLWRDACALVVPSTWYETFGMVVLEAWAHARTVLVSRIGGLSELIREKQNGRTFAPGDAQELARLLDETLADRNLMQAMGEQGHRDALTHFSLDRWSQEFSRILKQLPAERETR